MGRLGAGIATLGFLVLAVSAFFFVVSFMMLGLTPLPFLTGGLGLFMVTGGFLVAGLFSRPAPLLETRSCPTCGRMNPDGSTLCARCGRAMGASGTRLTCTACGENNESDGVYCKACASPL